MLSIIVLEDEADERAIIQRMIKNRISINPTPKEYVAQVVLSTGQPQTVLKFVAQHQDNAFLIFIDINLKTKIDGIEVASRIKGLCPSSQLVFVTANVNALKVTIKRHVAPLDYITKDAAAEEIQKRIYEVVDTAYQRYQQILENGTPKEYFTYSKIKGLIERMPLDEVYYLVLQPRKYQKLRVYAKNKIFDCNGTLKEFAKTYPKLILADRETLINLETVKSFDRQTGYLYFNAARTIARKVAVRRRRKIQQVLEKLH